VEIKWCNILVFVLLVIGAIVIINSPDTVASLLGSLESIGSPVATSDQRLMGLIVLLSLTLITIVAITTLARNDRED